MYFRNLQVEGLKTQLLEKDTEIGSLQTKLDTAQMKCSEQDHQVHDLTERNKAKDDQLRLLNQKVKTALKPAK